MLIAVGSDKGSPGATTFAAALAEAWTGERLLLELDPQGADLPFRLATGGGDFMAGSPSVTTLAVDARRGATDTRLLANYAQATTLGMPVIRGEVSTRAAAAVGPFSASIGEVASAWPGAVIADVGPLQPWNPVMPVLRSAAAVVLVCRASTEGLAHMRVRVEELVGQHGPAQDGVSGLGVVMVAGRGDQRAAVDAARTVLSHAGAMAQVLGSVAFDAAAVRSLYSGDRGKSFRRSALMSSVRDVAQAMWQQWPVTVPVPPHSTWEVMTNQPGPAESVRDQRAGHSEAGATDLGTGYLTVRGEGAF